MNGKRWAALGIAAVLFAVSAFVNLLSSFAFSETESIFSDFFGSKNDVVLEEVIEDGDAFSKVAVLTINGVIQDTGGGAPSILDTGGYNHRKFMEQLNYAKDDPSVRAIILRVTTPGGGVVESAEIHDKIVEIQQEVNKPVYISMGSMAASGGYYIAAPAKKIYASPETLTGSLGVIMQGVNYAGLAEMYGVEFVTIKSGPYKDIMSGAREMTEDERDILQRMIDNSYEGFVKVISEGREMSVDEVKRIADGRIYDGRQALELNLIDGFGYLEDVINAVKEDENLEQAQVVKYTENFGLNSLFGMGVQTIMSKGTEMEGIIHLLSQPNSPRLMYLYAE
ncbi:signal peptide peptidase SppA [Bacillus sp. B15-48]|uniref:signal peptide peptidase SppA n=1 Tax=Bacillus sp. B15-48 TaxID=1548601 RepID=UPI00193F79DF|nr:signal peptide peptidase SppA [Bacillus sp. B15-48]MBM4762566.1 signal peptide peptidase SppA [Bacillus sp. B15-48]